MSKTSKITKANSVFLTAVLVAGVIALSYPSFMVGAQAQEFNGMDQRYNNYEPEYGQDNKYNSYEPEYGTDYRMDSYGDKQSYGKDNSYDKSKDNSVIVKKVKCNNINWNLNGFSGNTLDSSTTSGLSALAADGEAEEEGANGVSGNDRRGGEDDRRGHDSNSRFVCINNNDNGQKEEDGAEEPGAEPDCTAGVACFASLDALELANLKLALGLGASVSNEVLCDILDSITPVALRTAITALPVGETDATATTIINCLIAAGFTNLES